MVRLLIYCGAIVDVVDKVYDEAHLRFCFTVYGEFDSHGLRYLLYDGLLFTGLQIERTQVWLIFCWTIAPK